MIKQDDTGREQTLKRALQRYFDHELSEEERVQVEAWIAENATANDYLRALQEIREGVIAAEASIWIDAGEPNPDVILDALQEEVAKEDSSGVDVDLVELMPLIERYADGEVDEEEASYMEQLIEANEEVRDYFESIRWMSEGVRLGIGSLFEDSRASSCCAKEGGDKQVDFSQFWGGVKAKLERLEEAEVPAEEEEDLEKILLRHDDEMTPSKPVRKVNAEEKDLLLKSLGDIRDGVQLASEAILCNVSFDGFYEAVAKRCEQLNNLEPEASMGEKSLNNEKLSSEVSGSQLTEIKADNDNVIVANNNFFARNRQAVAGALAALLVMGVVSVLYVALGGAKQTIIHKTVVVVEDVQYGPGLSGEVINPIQQVSARPEDFKAAENEGDEPTIIWVYDDPNQPNFEDKDNENVSERNSSDPQGKVKEVPKPRKRKAPGLSI